MRRRGVALAEVAERRKDAVDGRRVVRRNEDELVRSPGTGADVDPARYGETPDPTVVDVEPDRDAFEISLVKAARSRGLPILAICRGIQLMNVAFGGSLIQDIPTCKELVERIVSEAEAIIKARLVGMAA